MTLRLIRRSAEFVLKDNVAQLPRKLRGVYVLYRHHRKAGKDKYDVVYVGMAAAGRRGGIRGRLLSHFRKKRDLWTHFSAFEVWPNISDDEVAELEGLFRHIYRKDAKANRLNVQRGFKKMRRVLQNNLETWADHGIPQRSRTSTATAEREVIK
jgi:hypothetical protein